MRRLGGLLLALGLAAGCGRAEDGPAALAGIRGVDGPASITLRFQPPAGTRLSCPGFFRQVATVRDPERPLRQTLAGDREDREVVERVEGGRITLRRQFGELVWDVASPLPEPAAGTGRLPAAHSTATADGDGRLERLDSGESVAAALGDFLWQFRGIAGWPSGPIARGETLRREVRWLGPPGARSQLEARLEATLDGYGETQGRRCARFRIVLDGWLRPLQPEPDAWGGGPLSALHSDGWLCADVETGLALGVAADVRFSLTPPDRGVPNVDFRYEWRQGPCRYETD